MIDMVDCALYCAIAACIGVLLGGIGCAAIRTRPGSEQESAAKHNAEPRWVFVPLQNCDKIPVSPCITRWGRNYSQRYRN